MIFISFFKIFFVTVSAQNHAQENSIDDNDMKLSDVEVEILSLLNQTWMADDPEVSAETQAYDNSTEDNNIKSSDFDVLSLLNQTWMPDDTGVILLTNQGESSDVNTTNSTSNYDEDEYYDTEEQNGSSENPFNLTENNAPIMKNILRWLPKRKRKKIIQEQNRLTYEENRNKQRARQQHKLRYDTVVETMTKNYWTTLYLYGEVSRIRKKREVLDEMTKMIQTLESKNHEALKAKVLKCYKEAIRSRDAAKQFWNNKKVNNLIIDIIKDPPNEGVHN